MPHTYTRWREALEIAPDGDTVRGLMRDYVDSLRPVVVRQLPAECQKALGDPLNVEDAVGTLLQNAQ